MADLSSSESINLREEEAQNFVTAFNENGVSGIYKYATERLNTWRSIKVNIAVTGESGAGKSSFINAIRDLKVGDDGAAKTDVKETTKTVKIYKHPFNDNIEFSDLPGVGTGNFKRENYREKVELDKYDFFIIVSSRRFSENDGWLAEQIKNMGKLFYFVRSQVDNDVSSEPRSRRIPRPKDEILEKIRFDCRKNLESLGLPDSPVYLIDNLETSEFDFNMLMQKMIEEAPQISHEAILFSIHGHADDILRKKKKALEDRIPSIALASATAGAIPIPGLGLGIDIAILVKETNLYRQQFGLTEVAIKESADILGLKEEELRKELDFDTFLTNCSAKGLIAVLRECAVSATAAEIAKIVIPLLGSLINGVISYKTTSYCLQSILEDMYKASVKINEKVRLRLADTNRVKRDPVT